MDYQLLARRTDRRDRLIAFINKIGKELQFAVHVNETTPEHSLFEHLETCVEHVASSFLPTEQSGREITVYVTAGLKTPEQWTQIAGLLQRRFEAAQLPKLPLALGDAPVSGGHVMVEGVPHGYFSYRNEENTQDQKLGSHGFPHWIGGNAEKSHAGPNPLVFDQVRLG